jgi:hypothetical protein
LYQKNLGRQGAEEYVMNWVNSGMSLADIDQAIQSSPEGLAFASSMAGTAPADTTTDTTQTVTATAPVDTTADTTVTTATAPADTTTQTVATTNEGVPVGPTGLTSTQAAPQAIEEKNAAEAAAAAAAQSPANTFTNMLSTVQNPSSVKKQEDKPRMSFDDFYKTGFATGGIVDLTDGMNLEANSGQGLESFLRSRSKAALRRNLAKVAPRPTMQTGIVPMAR